MTEEFGIKLREEPKIKVPKAKPKVEKPKQPIKTVKPVTWESKLKVASAREIAKEFKRRGWHTVADIEANFREAKQVFVQLNVQNLIALFKGD